jgi:hypothetical protein
MIQHSDERATIFMYCREDNSIDMKNTFDPWKLPTPRPAVKMKEKDVVSMI